MFDLIFFSTNRTKLAHFRYIGNSYDIRIKSFREINYYASYNEPRIDDRNELLLQSYKSARDQWRKRQGRQDDDTATFFFEDTSVKILALSDSKHEVPGVNVKFWMKDMTFSRLDELLRRNGNNRRAVVRSDIVLHLPKTWRELLGTTEEFLVFVGEVEGKVCEREEIIAPNLVHNWLDEKSFNKWFVPDGELKPLSSLEISTANKYDFRRRAFSGVADALRRLNLLTICEQHREEQMELPRLGLPPSIFVICGPSCAGKTTLAAWLTKNFGLPHIEASDFMYMAFWERHGVHSNHKISDFARAALVAEPGIVAIPVATFMQERNFQRAVVTGFRSPAEIEIFESRIGQWRKSKLIYLDADFECRLDRALIRNRDGVTSASFAKREMQEQEMGLLKIKNLAKSSRLDNNGTLPQLFASSKIHFSKLPGSNISRAGLRLPTGLEFYIITALLDHMQNNYGTGLTTTEIAARINSLFLANKDKSKNNVSRYFNQEFHPYFEIALRRRGSGISRTVEYRLSPTGISIGILLIDNAKYGFTPNQRQITSQAGQQLNLFSAFDS